MGAISSAAPWAGPPSEPRTARQTPIRRTRFPDRPMVPASHRAPGQRRDLGSVRPCFAWAPWPARLRWGAPGVGGFRAEVARGAPALGTVGGSAPGNFSCARGRKRWAPEVPRTESGASRGRQWPARRPEDPSAAHPPESGPPQLGVGRCSVSPAPMLATKRPLRQIGPLPPRSASQPKAAPEKTSIGETRALSAYAREDCGLTKHRAGLPDFRRTLPALAPRSSANLVEPRPTPAQIWIMIVHTWPTSREHRFKPKLKRELALSERVVRVARRRTRPCRARAIAAGLAVAATALCGSNVEEVDYYTWELRLRDLLSHLSFNEISVTVYGARRSDRGWVLDAEVRWVASTPESTASADQGVGVSLLVVGFGPPRS